MPNYSQINMKKILALITLVFVSLITSAQTFEGKVIFKNSFKSKSPQVSDQQLGAMLGVNHEYMIKGGNYKNVTDGIFLQWQIYSNKDNKLYSKTAGKDAVLFNDCNENPDEVIKAEINRNVTKLLGHPCDELVLTCKSGVQKYYYSPGVVKIDPAEYKKHKFGNWSEVISRTNALPLKMIIDNAQFTLETEAVEIVPMKLDDELFTLPAGVTTEKNPYKSM